MKSKRLISIEILRFIAAFSVLLHHIPTLKIGDMNIKLSSKELLNINFKKLFDNLIKQIKN